MEKITCKGVNFTYPDSDRKALDNISFTVSEGEFCLLTGESAAGKSTLLRLLKSEIAPVGELSGEIKAYGKTGYVFQNVEESIVCDKVRSELSFGLTNMGLSGEKIELAVAEIASYFNIEKLLNSSISELSGGEKQLVNLASVMVMKPEILLLDEPCSQLDPVSAEHFLNLVKKLQTDFNITVIISEHSSEEVFDFADSLLLLDNGRLVIKAKREEAINYILENDLKIKEAIPIKYTLKGFDIKPYIPCDEKSSEAVRVKNIWYAYNKGEDVLKGAKFTAYKGKINAIIGANGSGKTTLLKTIAGVCKSYRGNINADGKLSMLTQNVYDLFTQERCGDEVNFGETTDFLGISEIENRHPYDISGGQAQRLAIAKLLERNADIIILDEPTRGLDALLKIRLSDLLKRLCESGKTVILASHDIEFVGAYCNYVSFLSDGIIITSQPRREFFSALSFYTTYVARKTNGKAVSLNDLERKQ